MKRVVCIGGGTGQAQVLKGLSRYPLRLTSIVNVTDNGGHSGFLRDALSIPPVGDLRSCLGALGKEGVLTELLQARFRQGALDGTSMGNLMLAALTTSTGSLARGVAAMSRLLGIRHQVLPVSDQMTDICAAQDDGSVVQGEWQILLRRPRRPIARLFHEPPVEALPECRSAIRSADLLVLCPGALMTAVISCLLARGIRESIERSRARIVQVCNLMTMPGQTDDLDALDHLALLSAYLGRSPDAFIVNTARPSARAVWPYRKVGSRPVRDDVPEVKGLRVIRGDFLGKERPADERGGKGLYLSLPHSVRHDHSKLAKVLYRLAEKS